MMQFATSGDLTALRRYAAASEPIADIFKEPDVVDAMSSISIDETICKTHLPGAFGRGGLRSDHVAPESTTWPRR